MLLEREKWMQMEHAGKQALQNCSVRMCVCVNRLSKCVFCCFPATPDTHWLLFMFRMLMPPCRSETVKGTAALITASLHPPHSHLLCGARYLLQSPPPAESLGQQKPDDSHLPCQKDFTEWRKTQNKIDLQYQVVALLQLTKDTIRTNTTGKIHLVDFYA